MWAVFCLSVLFAFSSCSDDDKTGGSYDSEALTTLITQAQSLVDNATEGIDAGLHKPGSKQELQDVIDWCTWKLENMKSQQDVNNAVVRLQKYVDIFNTSIVGVAVPWVQQGSGNFLELTDNPTGAGAAGRLRDVCADNYTVEADFYIINTATLGYSCNMFGYVQGDGGTKDLGLDVRYFGDGSIHLNVGGAGESWHNGTAPAGTVQSGKWIHVAAVISTTHQELYIDGNRVIAQDYAYGVPDAGIPFAVGTASAWQDRTINAMVKNVRVWSKKLSQQEIQDNIDADVSAEAANLEASFNLTADLGTDFEDATGRYRCKLHGDVVWMENGTPPVIVLEKDALNAAIATAQAFRATVTEGTNTGDYPVGTLKYLDSLIASAQDTLADAELQKQLDDAVAGIEKAIAGIKVNLVAPADGVYIDRENSDAVGLHITPGYTVSGSFTVELDLKMKTLQFAEGGDGGIFGFGDFGMFIYGYNELTEENVLNAGQVGNYNHWDGSDSWWMWLKSEGGVVRPGSWTHVALVHDDAAKTNTIYVDGVQVAQETGFEAPNVSDSEIWVGNYWAKINGSVKDFRVWNTALTSAQIGQEVTGTEQDLEMWFPLDKVAGVFFDAAKGDYQGEIRGIEWNVLND